MMASLGIARTPFKLFETKVIPALLFNAESWIGFNETFEAATGFSRQICQKSLPSPRIYSQGYSQLWLGSCAIKMISFVKKSWRRMSTTWRDKLWWRRVDYIQSEWDSVAWHQKLMSYVWGWAFQLLCVIISVCLNRTLRRLCRGRSSLKIGRGCWSQGKWETGLMTRRLSLWRGRNLLTWTNCRCI